MGHHFGVPFHRDLQKRVLLEALDLLETAQVSGTIRDIPIKWADVRREANPTFAPRRVLPARPNYIWFGCNNAASKRA